MVYRDDFLWLIRTLWPVSLSEVFCGGFLMRQNDCTRPFRGGCCGYDPTSCDGFYFTVN